MKDGVSPYNVVRILPQPSHFSRWAEHKIFGTFQVLDGSFTWETPPKCAKHFHWHPQMSKTWQRTLFCWWRMWIPCTKDKWRQIQGNFKWNKESWPSHLIETPKRPWPPQRVLGVMNTSLNIFRYKNIVETGISFKMMMNITHLTVWLLLLYTVIAISFSTFAWNNISLSKRFKGYFWFARHVFGHRDRKEWLNYLLSHLQQMLQCIVVLVKPGIANRHNKVKKCFQSSFLSRRAILGKTISRLNSKAGCWIF